MSLDYFAKEKYISKKSQHYVLADIPATGDFFYGTGYYTLSKAGKFLRFMQPNNTFVDDAPNCCGLYYFGGNAHLDYVFWSRRHSLSEVNLDQVYLIREKEIQQ